MMKMLPIIIVLLCPYTNNAQLIVDTIKTGEGVKAFVSAYGKQNGYKWTTVTVGDYQAYDDRFSRRIKNLDSLSSCKWIIEDFNNDGRQDLIYNSIIDDQRYFFSLLSRKDKGYDYFNLHKWYHNVYPYEIAVLKKDTNTLLILNETKYVQKDTDWQKLYLVDTLQAVLGGFIERPKKINKRVTFDNLEFQFSHFPLYLAGMGFPMSMRLTITKDNQMKYSEDGSVYKSVEIEDDWNEWVSIEHSMHLLNKDRGELYQLLSLTNLGNMKDSFSISASHMDVAYIIVKTGKKKKIIVDEGLEGSYWLRLFYKKMFALSKRLRIDIAKYFQQNNFYD